MPRNKTQEANMAAASMESTDGKTEANVSSGQDVTLREIRKLKMELLSKIAEKAEMQATEIRNQCEQLREGFKHAMDQADMKTTVLAARVLSIEGAGISPVQLAHNRCEGETRGWEREKEKFILRYFNDSFG